MATKAGGKSTTSSKTTSSKTTSSKTTSSKTTSSKATGGKTSTGSATSTSTGKSTAVVNPNLTAKATASLTPSQRASSTASGGTVAKTTTTTANKTGASSTASGGTVAKTTTTTANKTGASSGGTGTYYGSSSTSSKPKTTTTMASGGSATSTPKATNTATTTATTTTKSSVLDGYKYNTNDAYSQNIASKVKAAEAAGKSVYVSTDNNGTLHYSTESQAKADSYSANQNNKTAASTTNGTELSTYKPITYDTSKYLADNTNTEVGAKTYSNWATESGLTNEDYIKSKYKYYAQDANGVWRGSNTESGLKEQLATAKTLNADGSYQALNGETFYAAKSSYTPVNGSVYNNATGSNVNATIYYDDNGNPTAVAYDPNASATPTALDNTYITDDNGNMKGVLYMDADGNWQYGSETQFQNYVDLLYYQQQAEDESNYWAYTQAMMDDYLTAIQETTQAAVDKSVEEIESTIEQGVTQYGQDAAQAYLELVRSQNNAQLNNAYSGDLGGIGTKQYDSATATYDQALLQIELEKEAFVNACNEQINQLKAEGRLQDAETLAEWAKTKISLYTDYYNNTQEWNLTQQQIDNNKEANDREYYYNKAVDLLNMGMVTADVLTALGLDEAQAQVYANRINALAQASVDSAQAELDNLVAEIDNANYQKALTMLEQGFVTADILTTLGISKAQAQNYADTINAARTLSLDQATAELDNALLQNSYLAKQIDLLGAKTTSTTTDKSTDNATPLRDTTDKSTDNATPLDDTTDYGSVTIYNADGTSKDYKLNANGEVNEALSNGSYMTDGKGNKTYYYNGEWVDESAYGRNVYTDTAKSTALQNAASLTGITAGSSNISAIRMALVKKLDDDARKLDILESQMTSYYGVDPTKYKESKAAYKQLNAELGNYQAVYNDFNKYYPA